MSTYDEWGEPIVEVTRKRRGMATHTTALLNHMIAVVAEMAPIGVRGVSYQLLVRHVIASMAIGETQRVSRLLVQAREEGIVSWDDIVDESRQYEEPFTFDNKAEYAEYMSYLYHRDYWATQPYRVHLWSEKNTAGGLLRQVLRDYGIPFLNVHGFNSATAMKAAAVRSSKEPRETILLYVGDWDPSGMYMSEEDIPARMRKYGGRVTIRRIALTADDLADLPSIAAKPADPRFKWYQRRYGVKAWELDALNPNVLRNRVEDAIKEYIDEESWGRMQIVEAAEQRSITHFLTQLPE